MDLLDYMACGSVLVIISVGVWAFTYKPRRRRR